MNKLPKLIKIILAVLFLAAFSQKAWSTDQVSVEYYPTTGNLTVKAEDAKLDGVLAIVSHKTGVWIRIDPSIEKRITIDLNDTPLERVLLQLSRGLSHAMIYESMDYGDGHRLVGVEILSNEAVSGRGTRSHGRADTRFFTGATRGGSLLTDQGLRDNGSPQPDPGIHNRSTVDNAGLGSRPNTAPEQSSDMAIAGFTPAAGDAVTSENAGDKSPVDSDTKQPAHIPNEKIASPKGGAFAGGY